MTNTNLNSSTRIHFIGIGGISMSGLAEIMHNRGHIVSGSDMKASEIITHLEMLGILTMPTHSKSNITADIDIVVYTAAIAEDNPELVEAKRLVENVISRAEFLGLVMQTYDFPICISGTHGKTTTTSMLANILLGAKKNPTITVGGIVEAIKGNIHIGGNKYFLTEACEYHNSFLDFFPKIGVILNIEEDHMDFFENLQDIQHSFTKFAQLIPADGLLVIQKEAIIPAILEINAPIQTFGFGTDADWYPTNITFNNKIYSI